LARHGSSGLRLKINPSPHEIRISRPRTCVKNSKPGGRNSGGLIIDIPPGPKRRSYARRRVLVRQHLDGAWTVWLDETRIARHPATPLREPLRTWKPRQRNENRRTRHILQVYLETTPAPSPWGHFCPADKGTS
jgi:hypothetical protein